MNDDIPEELKEQVDRYQDLRTKQISKIQFMTEEIRAGLKEINKTLEVGLDQIANAIIYGDKSF